MKRESYATETFQTIPLGSRWIDHKHPESALALALGLPKALGSDLAVICDMVKGGISSGRLDDESLELISHLSEDVCDLALAQTALDDVRRERVALVKQASAAKRDTFNRMMLCALRPLLAPGGTSEGSEVRVSDDG